MSPSVGRAVNTVGAGAPGRRVSFAPGTAGAAFDGMPLGVVLEPSSFASPKPSAVAAGVLVTIPAPVCVATVARHAADASSAAASSSSAAGLAAGAADDAATAAATAEAASTAASAHAADAADEARSKKHEHEA